MSAPLDILERSLESLRAIEADLATVSPRLRADPAWNEIDKAVKRAIGAAIAAGEYASVRPERFTEPR